ncbi:acyltransferase domain-containing protein, partial [Paractinoplanes durhamensis]|uniref:acyltransferase domain-containing protein n=1 Tax=Paractinoplanes durhamensis TaxID=113563 RepID=UPI0031D082B0
AGVIKSVLAMQHGVLPATLHVDEPTPEVDWSEGAVSLLTEAVPWPDTRRLHRIGVSAFGVSGTNAHVILEQAPEPVAEPSDGSGLSVGGGLVPLVVSGRSAAALQAQAGRLAGWLDARPEADLLGTASGLVGSRAGLSARGVVVGSNRDELVSGLRALASGEPAVVGGAPVVSGVAGPADPVFVFPGQGSQWVRMGLGLASVEPVFAAALDECAAVLRPLVGWDLREALADEELLGRVDVVQPALWAVMVSLARLWQWYGVQPAVVVGHSQGEIAAACVAGVLSLQDGARVVVLRSRALVVLSGRGGMVSVAAGVDVVDGLVQGWGDRLAVAAVNGPEATVVSGDREALAGLVGLCERRGVRARWVDV